MKLGNYNIRIYKERFSWSSGPRFLANYKFHWFKLRVGKMEYILSLIPICRHESIYCYTNTTKRCVCGYEWKIK